MEIIVDETSELGSCVFIKGEMTIPYITEIKETLHKKMKDDAYLKLDLSGVYEFDSSGFQLICFLRNEARRLGSNFEIVAMSEQVRNLFETYRYQLDGGKIV